MRSTRLGLVAGGALLATLLSIDHAGAGGSTWNITPDPAAPGEVVHAEALASWGHNDRMGTPADGPWRAWIRPLDDPDDPTFGALDIPDDAISVGDIAITDEGGRGTATIDFVVPQVPAGDYELIHCNDPCTSTLGDITWGVFTIRSTEPATGGASSTTTSTSTPASTSTSTAAAVPPAAGGAHGSVPIALEEDGDDQLIAGLRATDLLGGILAVLLLFASISLLPSDRRSPERAGARRWPRLRRRGFSRRR